MPTRGASLPSPESAAFPASASALGVQRGLLAGDVAYRAGHVHSTPARHDRTSPATSMDSIPPHSSRPASCGASIGSDSCSIALRLALEDANLLGRRDADRGQRSSASPSARHRRTPQLVELSRPTGQRGTAARRRCDFSNTVGNAPPACAALSSDCAGTNVTFSQKEASAWRRSSHAAIVLRGGPRRRDGHGRRRRLRRDVLQGARSVRRWRRDAGAGEASRPFDRRRNGFVLG